MTVFAKTRNAINRGSLSSRGIVALCIVSSLILAETFSGALRYYLDQFGLGAALSVPKVLAVAFIFFEMGTRKSTHFLLLPVLTVGAYSCVALFHGVPLENILFSYYTWSPILLGVVAHKYIHQRRSFVLILLFCVVASSAGVLVNNFRDLPWQGYMYKIGDTQLEGSRDWSAFDVSRLAGFARISVSAAIGIALPILYVAPNIKNFLVRNGILAASLIPIYLTTHKASIVALALGVLVLKTYRKKGLALIVCATLLGAAIWLPFSTSFENYVIDMRDDVDLLLFASFDDRLNNTWPDFIDVANQFANPVIGVGFGAVGSSLRIFEVPALLGRGGGDLAVSDNTALALWGSFGALGVIIYASLFFVFKRLYDYDVKASRGLIAVAIAIFAIGIVTDVPESPMCMFFLGLTISQSRARSHKRAVRFESLRKMGRQHA
ncbi:hypothetical protein R69746_07430 [Paraburkholderia aspalathi]|uniref:O-antigen ligase family protein n=1 Tax=Paraburkholderia aspalathi TaxID=1324617 RepID=UPI00190D4CF5|nr:O-antigen ligase family protein [Paraburkholderia aspalathi]MBK3843381.1 hypothetical protein [Paraburkholderia aspalathi]CAE6852606.1 hypothetical protein R69746_07430 [Paraburkholderia aspalathi]